MNYELFRALEPAEAQQFLVTYLEMGRSDAEEVAATAAEAGVVLDYSLSSVPEMLKWQLSMVRTVPREAESVLPGWIRSSPTYLRNLFDFDEPSRDFVLRGSYYLGESFVRQSSRLFWKIGEKGFAQENMPVVTGFSDEVELPPILVVNNLFRRILAGSGSLSDIDKAIKTWRSRTDTPR